MIIFITLSLHPQSQWTYLFLHWIHTTGSTDRTRPRTKRRISGYLVVWLWWWFRIRVHYEQRTRPAYLWCFSIQYLIDKLAVLVVISNISYHNSDISIARNVRTNVCNVHIIRTRFHSGYFTLFIMCSPAQSTNILHTHQICTVFICVDTNICQYREHNFKTTVFTFRSCRHIHSWGFSSGLHKQVIPISYLKIHN